MYCIYIYEESWMLYAIDAWNMMWSNSLVGLEITEACGSAILIFSTPSQFELSSKTKEMMW